MLATNHPLGNLNTWQSVRNWQKILGSLSSDESKELHRLLSDRLAFGFNRDWPLKTRLAQQVPETDWTNWLLMGGRGSGKTRAGAEWVRGVVLGDPLFSKNPVGRIALIGEDQGDVRAVMIEGDSGLLAIHTPNERPTWLSSRRRLERPNGAVAEAFSSKDPDALRGPQFEAAWCDELAKWDNADATWDNLQFGLRLCRWRPAAAASMPHRMPARPVATTPKPRRATPAPRKWPTRHAATSIVLSPSCPIRRAHRQTTSLAYARACVMSRPPTR